MKELYETVLNELMEKYKNTFPDEHEFVKNYSNDEDKLLEFFETRIKFWYSIKPSTDEFRKAQELSDGKENYEENDEIKALLLKSQICDLRVLQLDKGVKELNLKEKLHKKLFRTDDK